MKRMLLKIAYDGTAYYGWQRQNNFITVQQRLEESLSRLLGQEISVRGSSRTDTGVHALGQGAVFKADFTIPEDRFPYALNSFLPEDIVCRGARLVDEEFHPQYSVVKKTYKYSILNDRYRNPLLDRYCEFVPKELDTDKMSQCCKYFLGEHDFKAFCASGSTAKTTNRTIYDLTVEKNQNIIDIEVTGNGFLYNMVRIIAGTLVDVGLGKIPVSDVEKIIAWGDRTKAGKTLPPRGLALMNIVYDFMQKKG
ncbi:MAG: tRNA pseudouridine(38-40) synthase TruA [Clostridiales bacterium]|nr:tRNA pseudouridine(38-40) synthase TruA [Clostridiales bacterium]